MILPAWLARRELDPGSGAYGDLPAPLRAALKTQIALLDALWEGAAPACAQARDLSPASRVLARYFPRDWTVFLLAPGYASPAGLIAAVLPAVEAGVGRVLVCRADPPGAGLPAALSAALELLGQEYLYGLPHSEDALLLEQLAGQGGAAAGGLVCLGETWEGLMPWLRQAQTLGIWTRTAPGRVAVALTEGADEGLLRWLHPQAELRSGGTGWDPFALPGDGPPAADVTLGPGQEPFWVWPHLGPREFFRQCFVARALPQARNVT